MTGCRAIGKKRARTEAFLPVHLTRSVYPQSNALERRGERGFLAILGSNLSYRISPSKPRNSHRSRTAQYCVPPPRIPPRTNCQDTTACLACPNDRQLVRSPGWDLHSAARSLATAFPGTELLCAWTGSILTGVLRCYARAPDLQRSQPHESLPTSWLPAC